MLYKLKGFPEQDEIVLCKVTKIFPNSVFVDLLEYGKQGMVHISEVSPGRIRNLRDFVSENRQIICKVLSVNEEREHIDLSLRRVNSSQRKEKLEEVKQELKAENLIQMLSKKLGQPIEKIYQKVAEKVLKDYSYLYLCFRDVAAEEASLEELGIEKKLAQELTEVIIEKFKPKKIIVQGEIRLSTYDENGLDKIKNVLMSIEKLSQNIKLRYLGAGRFKIVIEEDDYQAAEKILKKAEQIVEKFKDKISEAVIEREKKE